MLQKGLGEAHIDAAKVSCFSRPTWYFQVRCPGDVTKEGLRWTGGEWNWDFTEGPTVPHGVDAVHQGPAQLAGFWCPLMRQFDNAGFAVLACDGPQNSL